MQTSTKQNLYLLEHISCWTLIMTTIPIYDFPSFSPILVVGFLGIAVSLYTLYIVNKAYYNSPFRVEAWLTLIELPLRRYLKKTFSLIMRITQIFSRTLIGFECPHYVIISIYRWTYHYYKKFYFFNILLEFQILWSLFSSFIFLFMS